MRHRALNQRNYIFYTAKQAEELLHYHKLEYIREPLYLFGSLTHMQYLC
jgi:hypothetical protein